MANDQALLSIEEPQSNLNEATNSKKVLSTKRPHEAKTSKIPCKSPSKIARVSPSKGTPTKGTPTKDTSTKDTPTKGTPTKGTPTKDTPTKGTPTKDTPTKDTSAKGSSPPRTCNCRWAELANKQRDSEMEKLRRNLQKCQDELREEVEKRGMSSAARTASEKDRSRLLNEIKQLGVSKRRLESALESSQVTVRKMEAEVKASREACKLQVTSVEKTSALEVKRLLEDLKVKDQMLASLDRNQYSDRSVQLKIVQQKQQQQQQQQQHQQLQQLKEQQEKDIKKELQVQIEREVKQEWKQKLEQQQANSRQQLKQQQGNKDSSLKQHKKIISENNTYISSLKSEIVKLQSTIKATTNENKELVKEKDKVNDEKTKIENKMESLKEENDKMSQTLTQLQDEVSGLHESLADSKVEEALRQFEELKQQTSQSHKSAVEKIEKKQKKSTSRHGRPPSRERQSHKKTVKFLLPDSSKPVVNGRIAYKEDMRFLFFDDDDEKEDEEWHDDDDDDDDEDYSVKNFKPKLQCDSMSESSDEIKGILSKVKKSEAVCSEDYTKLMNDHMRLEKAYTNLSNKKIKEWMVERESLNLAILALEGKNHEYETSVKQLTLQVDEIKDKNEELEFQVLELEGCRGDVKNQEATDALLEDLQQKNRILEDQVTELSRGIHLMSETTPLNDVVKMDKEVQCLLSEKSEEPQEGKKTEGYAEFEGATLTSSTTSGIEDLSSDEDEACIESMPHDNEQMVTSIPCYDESRAPRDADETPKKLGKVIESLELRLACSKLRENSLLDKIALLCEEKKKLLDTVRSDEDTLEEYVAIEKDLNAIGCYEDDDSGVTEDWCGSVEEQDGVNPTDLRKVAAKLKKRVLFEKSSEGIKWMEQCLRLDTPTKEDMDYPHYIQSFTAEGDNELLSQKVMQLEKDSDALREVVDMDEGLIRELQIKVFDLENSEKALQRALETLEESEKTLKSSKEELEEENDKLSRELIRLRTSEEQLHSNLDISRSNESQFKKKLEEVSQDLKETERKLRKKVAVAEKLEESAAQSNEKFEDQLGELESVIELFKKRNSNLERLCEDLNSKLMEAEKQSKRFKLHAECMDQQRDTLVSRIQALERERSLLVEKVTAANKNLEEKGAQLEMALMETKGWKINFEALEAEKEEFLKRWESQKDVEMILMEEMEAIKEQNCSLKNRFVCMAQEKMTLSINHGSQTSSDDSYQEEASQHYDEYEDDNMKVSLSMSEEHTDTDSHYSIDDTPKKISLRRSKSLNDLKYLFCHKLTQTTPALYHAKQGFSMIPIRKHYQDINPNHLSQPPSMSQPAFPHQHGVSIAGF